MPPRKARGKASNHTPSEESSSAAAGSTAVPERTDSSNPIPPSQHESETQSFASLPPATSAQPARLESLKSASPSMSSNRGRKGPVAKPKFAGRRSQAARAELEKEEAAKKAAEEAETLDNARKQKRSGPGFGGDRGGRGRGRGGRGRGRGGHTDFTPRVPIASGPFSAGQASQDIKSGHGRWSSGGGGGGSGPFGGGGGARSGGWGHGTSGPSAVGIKTEGGSGELFVSSTGRMRSVKAEDGGYISSDDEDIDGFILKKQDIDELQNRTIDLTGVDDEPPENPFAPVRLKRHLVTERKVGLSAEELAKRAALHNNNADASTAISDKKKGKARAQEVEITGSAKRSGHATTYSSSSDAENAPDIKAEPMDDESDLGSLEAAAPASSRGLNNPEDPPSSPDTKRKAKESIRASVMDDDTPFQRPKTPPFPTQQEVTEFHRIWEDRAAVYAELGQIAPQKKNAPQTTTDGDGDVPMTDKPSEEKSVRDDEVYLFQLPSILPDLYPIGIKPDPEDDVEMEESADVDQEDKKSSKQAMKGKAENDQSSEPKPHLPSGKVGKLRIHKSGKAYLDFGGHTLQLCKGMQLSHLKSVLTVKVPDQNLEEGSDQQPPEVPGRAVGLGEIKDTYLLSAHFWDDDV